MALLGRGYPATHQFFFECVDQVVIQGFASATTPALHPICAEVEEYRAGVAQSDAFGFFLNRCKQEPWQHVP